MNRSTKFVSIWALHALNLTSNDCRFSWMVNGNLGPDSLYSHLAGVVQETQPYCTEDVHIVLESEGDTTSIIRTFCTGSNICAFASICDLGFG